MVTQLLPIFLISFAVFVLFFLLMGIGYMLKKEPLRGSCGRVANLMGDEICSFCGDDPNKCDDNEKSTFNNNSVDFKVTNKAKELGKSIL